MPWKSHLQGTLLIQSPIIIIQLTKRSFAATHVLHDFDCLIHFKVPIWKSLSCHFLRRFYVHNTNFNILHFLPNNRLWLLYCNLNVLFSRYVINKGWQTISIIRDLRLLFWTKSFERFNKIEHTQKDINIDKINL